jgi:hypothetical protein
MTQATFTAEQVAALKEAGVLAGTKNDPASTTLGGANLHGPLQSGSNWGIFSQPGRKPDMFSAMPRALSLQAYLDMMPSDLYRNEIDLMTGVTEEGGTNATGWCGDPPSTGMTKKCTQRYSFGKYYIKDELVAAAQVGLRKNRADVPRNILNLGAGSPLNRFVPESAFTLDDTFSQLRLNQFLVGVSAERDVCHVAIQGNAALGSANTQHGWIAEFTGLDSQIKTGYTDLDTGYACPAADSIVTSFNAAVSGTDAFGRTITEAWQDLMRGLTRRASRAGLSGVVWAAVMREELFYALTAQIACNYFTTRCTAATNAAQNQDAPQIEMMRLDMLEDQYLLADGKRIPVILDECMPQASLANKRWHSDLFVIPVAWNGMPLTYFEYFPMDNQYATEFTQMLGQQVARLNNGLWLVGERDTGLCLEHHYQMMIRLVLEAPFLAGRLDDIFYYYYPETNDAIPGASLHRDGGVSYLHDQYV